MPMMNVLRITLAVAILSLLNINNISFSAQNKSNGYGPQKEHCFENLWQDSNSTDDEKAYDLEHDVSVFGYRFSCQSEVTPSEINKTLSIVKKAIENNDKEGLANIAIYPYGYWIDTEERTEFGFREPKYAQNKSEFIANYDDIVDEGFRKIFSCTNIDNIEPGVMGNVSIGEGYSFFAKEPDNNKDIVRNFKQYPMRLESNGPFMERHDEWVVEHCQ